MLTVAVSLVEHVCHSLAGLESQVEVAIDHPVCESYLLPVDADRVLWVA